MLLRLRGWRQDQIALLTTYNGQRALIEDVVKARCVAVLLAQTSFTIALLLYLHIHTYVHTCVHAYIYTYIHTHVHTYVYTYIRT